MKRPSLPSLFFAAGVGLTGYAAYDYWSPRPVGYKSLSNEDLQKAISPGLIRKIEKLSDKATADLDAAKKPLHQNDIRAILRTLDIANAKIEELATASQEACARMKDGRIKPPTTVQAQYLVQNYCKDMPQQAATYKRLNDESRTVLRQALTQ